MDSKIYKTQIPDLLKVQKSSFVWFLTKGLAEEFRRFPSFFDLPNNYELHVYAQEYKIKGPKFSELESQKKDITYSIKIYIPVKITNKNFLERDKLENLIDNFSKERLYIGEIPLMTSQATFIYNGYKRIILNQLVRSCGLYYNKEKSQNAYTATILPGYGSWLSFELQEKDFLWVRIDKVYKIPIHWFLAALKLSKNEVFGSIKNAKKLKLIFENMKRELERIKQTNLKKLKGSTTHNFSSIFINNKTNEENAILEVQNLINSKIFNSKYYDLSELGRLRLNKKLGLHFPLSQRILTSQDILKIIDNLLTIKFYSYEIDDIDSLKNRRVRSVGELLQVQIRIGLTRLEKSVEQKIIRGQFSLLLQNWITPKPILSIMKEFFGSSQLSQFMDEINPLSEMTHKRRISSLGPGGLSGDHVSFVARDIHPTQYGRLCPIETSEGEHAGLIASLATYAKIDLYGFLQTPFLIVEKGKVRLDQKLIYLSAEEEEDYKIALGDLCVNLSKSLDGQFIPIRYRHEFSFALPSEVNLMSVSPIQIFSAAACLIPFVEHDDANRALMGSNMQRQAVPLIRPRPPIIGTGLETQIALDSRSCIINKRNGLVTFVSANKIEVYDGTKIEHYFLQKYLRTNQDTCLNQKPIVWCGEFVKSGQILADGPAMFEGELALGQNLNVAYMPWEGYNYEDAILVSEKLVYENLFTSIHIERYEVEIEQTRVGPEKITRDIPNASYYLTRHLDHNGLVRIGAMIQSYDVLVGKVAPKEEIEETPEVRLLNAIFGTKTPTVYDTSLTAPSGVSGRVIDISFSCENNKNLIPGTVITVFVAQIRKLQIGDKIAGRHGNKGVISKILPFEDMPYSPDGTVMDIILNPLGVPSRMNVGQIFECLLGLAGDYLQQRFSILPFDEMYAPEASRILINRELKKASEETKKFWLYNQNSLGKVILTDGRTGEAFDNPILIGKAYVIKLIHLVDDKIHARSTGPYSLITQQPLGGKSQNGGQRFGEMEVWALEAYGAAYTLQEILTIKSDDMYGRNEMLSALVRGHALPKPSVPESFNVLLCELKALGIEIQTYNFKTFNSGFSQSTEVNLLEMKKFLNVSDDENYFQTQKKFNLNKIDKKKKNLQKKNMKKINLEML